MKAQYAVKDSYVNTRNIFKIIRSSTSEPVFKAELARLTGLSIPTVMRITDELVGKRLVRPVGKGESKGGKPPQLLEFVGDAAYIIGLDIATDSIRVVCTNLGGESVYERKHGYDMSEDSSVVLGHMVSAIDGAISGCGSPKDAILGIGIAVPGILDLEKGLVIYSPDLGWENVEIVNHIKDHFGMPVFMENDSQAKACGEIWYGLAKDERNFITINFGYGIGAAMVFDGKVYHGESGSAGELGHMILDRKGALCDCGNYGCTEALASGNSIAKMAKHRAFGGSCRRLLKLAGSIEAINDEIVFQAASQGDEEAMDMIDECLEYLGFAIANLIMLLDPGLVIIENYYAAYADRILSKIRSEAERYGMRKIGKKTRFMLSELGEFDGCIGAASVLFDRWANVGFNKNLL
jgi:N-acetylglucosamine repressor